MVSDKFNKYIRYFSCKTFNFSFMIIKFINYNIL